MLPVMAAGLNSIIFSLAVDVDYLNTPQKDMAIPVLTPVLQPRSTSAGPSFIDRLSVVTSHEEESDVVAVKEEKKTRRKKKRPSQSPSPPTLPSSSTHPPPPPSPPSSSSSSTNPPPPPVISQASPTPPPPSLPEAMQSTKEPTPVRQPSEELLDISDIADPGMASSQALGSSRGSTPSIISLSDDSSLTNGPLFVPPSDPEEAIRATSMVLAATEHQERERERDRGSSPLSQVRHRV